MGRQKIVIADDLTGAAEIAGLCHRYGLSSSIAMGAWDDIASDVLIICTDTRSSNEAMAVIRTRALVQELAERNKTVFYKKIDSVGRGHVEAELAAQLVPGQPKRVFIAPANPSLGRTISNQQYFVQGVPLAETPFSLDPDFPMRSSTIREVLGLDATNFFYVEEPDKIPVSGWVTGPMESAQQVDAWAARDWNGWMLAGAGDFFEALLKQEFSRQDTIPGNIETPLLYVSGTAFSERVEFIREQKQAVLIGKSQLSGNADAVKEWVDQVGDTLKRYPITIVAFDETDIGTLEWSAFELRQRMASLVRKLLLAYPVKELMLEGGSSAASLLAALNIRTLQTQYEWERGVVTVGGGAWKFTLKPGSYPLPSHIRRLLETK